LKSSQLWLFNDFLSGDKKSRVNDALCLVSCTFQLTIFFFKTTFVLHFSVLTLAVVVDKAYDAQSVLASKFH